MSTTRQTEFYSFVPPAGVGTGLANSAILMVAGAAGSTPALVIPVALTQPDGGVWVAVTTATAGVTIRFGSSTSMGAAAAGDVVLPPNTISRFRIGLGTQFASVGGVTANVFFWRANF